MLLQVFQFIQNFTAIISIVTYDVHMYNRNMVLKLPQGCLNLARLKGVTPTLNGKLVDFVKKKTYHVPLLQAFHADHIMLKTVPWLRLEDSHSVTWAKRQKI